jgi:hypothetical protein
MLHPDERLTFTDALRPPAGHRLDFALGATYSLDLETLLAAPAAFALQTVDVGDLSQLDALALLHSVRSNAKRILVVHQAGQMSVPRSHRLFAFLEASVAAVSAPRDGVFHPKFWVLRYQDIDTGVLRHRVVIASRNITADRSWDVVLRLDSRDGQSSSADMTGLSQLIRAIPGIVTHDLPSNRLAEIEQLATEIETVRFDLPDGVDTLRIHAFGVEGHEQGATPFPDDVERLLVISPFLSGPRLDALPRSRSQPMLVSRAESMDPLPNSLDRFSTFVLDPAAADDRDDEADQTTEIGNLGTTLSGLHAKVYSYDQGGRSHLLVGSANATSAAFTRNVEMLAELVGRVDLLGVEAIIGPETADGAEQPRGEASFRDLLIRYKPDSLPVDEPAQRPSALDEFRQTIGALPFTGTVEPVDEEYTVTYRAPYVDLPAGIEATCFPITIAGRRRALLDEGGSVLATFTVSLESLTSFLGICLSDGDDETIFVVPVALLGAPDNRDQLVLQALLGNAERFIRYLLYLLADESMSDLEVGQLLDAVEGTAEKARRSRVDTAPVLEQMLRALRTDPERLRPIAELVESLGPDTNVLPPGLLDIWEPIVEVAKEQWR